MDLNNITTQVRPRNKWQALDLGFKMASQWYFELLKSYLVIAIPLFIIVNLVFFELPIVAMVLFWWLKPIGERIQLVFLSHALFGQQLNLKQQIALWMQTPKVEWFHALLTHRLTLRRSYKSPIRQLENQRGKSFTKRKIAFKGHNDQAATWLTFILAHLESMIVMAMLILANYLLPEQTGISFDVFGIEDTSVATSIYNNALILFSYTLIAPFYTCGGFSLYLNQRTQIEGWDIEISFKRLMARTENTYANSAKTTTAAKSVLIAMLIGYLTSYSEPLIAAQANPDINVQTTLQTHQQASAQTDEQTDTSNDDLKTPNQQQAYDQIQTIIKTDTFNQKVTHSYPEAFLNFKPDNKEDQDNQFDLPEWLFSLIKMLSTSIEWLLSLLVLTLLILFCVRYRHWFRQFLPASAQHSHHGKHQQVFGLEIPHKDTINDVQQQAYDLWQVKQKREALSLLYRASLQVLMGQEHIKVRDAFTEGECLQQVKQNASKTISQYFNRLTQSWQRLAYANQEPDDATLSKLIEQWSQIFIPSNITSSNDASPNDTGPNDTGKAQGDKS